MEGGRKGGSIGKEEDISAILFIVSQVANSVIACLK